VQLGLADVDAGHRGGPALEEAVGEAPGGGADVEGVPARGVEPESVEGPRELLAPAGDEARGLVDEQRAVDRQALGGLGHHGVGSGAHLAGEDEGLGEGAGGGEPAGDEQLVGAHLGDGLGHDGRRLGPAGRKGEARGGRGDHSSRRENSQSRLPRAATKAAM